MKRPGAQNAGPLARVSALVGILGERVCEAARKVGDRTIVHGRAIGDHATQGALPPIVLEPGRDIARHSAATAACDLAQDTRKHDDR